MIASWRLFFYACTFTVVGCTSYALQTTNSFLARFTFVVFVFSVTFSGHCNRFHQELSPLSENVYFILDVFVIISSPRERFLLSPAIGFWYPKISHIFIMPKILIPSLLWSGFIPYSPLCNPVDTAFSRNIVELGKRLFSRSVRKKEPLSTGTLYRICPTFVHSNSNLKDLRTVLLFALGFYGLFRISELLDL